MSLKTVHFKHRSSFRDQGKPANILSTILAIIMVSFIIIIFFFALISSYEHYFMELYQMIPQFSQVQSEVQQISK